MILPKLSMRESLAGSSFSTRLRNALINIAGYPGARGWNLGDVVRDYHKDPDSFAGRFLRVAGAGRVSLDEFIAYANRLDGDDDLTGRTVTVAFEEAAHLQDEIGALCHSVDSRTSTYRVLRRLQSLLDAGTIHLEQVEDDRPMFTRKGAS